MAFNALDSNRRQTLQYLAATVGFLAMPLSACSARETLELGFFKQAADTVPFDAVERLITAVRGVVGRQAVQARVSEKISADYSSGLTVDLGSVVVSETEAVLAATVYWSTSGSARRLPEELRALADMTGDSKTG